MRGLDVVGVYSLVAMNDRGLPFETYGGADVREELISGSLCMDRDGNLLLKSSFRFDTSFGSAARDDNLIGKFTVVGSQIHAVFDSLPPVNFALSGDTLTAAVGGLRFSFSKEKSGPDRLPAGGCASEPE